MTDALLAMYFSAAMRDDGASGSRGRRSQVPAPAPVTDEAIDRALWGGVCAGSADAFDGLVDRYFDRLARFAYTIVRARDSAEDIAQETLVAVWELGAEWRPAGTVAAYLLRATRNRALNVVGRTRRRDDIAPQIRDDVAALHAAPTADERLETEELIATLRTAITALPERRRTALRLRYVERLTYPAIAEIMRISVKSAEQLVALTLTTLRKLMARGGHRRV